MTTEPAHPTNPAAHALAVLVFATLTVGTVITATLTAVGAPWWLALAPWWAPAVAVYVAIVAAAAVTFARALVRSDRGGRG